jgi:phospholipase/lecithinase/hemolysin
MGFMAGMTRSLRAAGGVLTAALIVAACGGGSSRETFTPTRLIAFGDESSVITSDGHKYTVNLETNGVLDCAGNPIWIQVLASAYGFGFQQCKPTGITNEQALMRATVNAKVADLVTQIDAHLAIDAFTGKDLVTVLVGANDILEQYSAYPGQSEDELKATLTARGAAVAGQVNRIANAGGKVLAITVPDVGLTPFALAQGADRAALLQRLTAAFNTALRLNLLNDGTKIGLIIEDELVQAYVSAGANSGFTNWTEHACDPATGPMPNCTTSTLVTGATSTSYLWADDLQLSPGGHARLGSAALTRAQNNPF